MGGSWEDETVPASELLHPCSIYLIHAVKVVVPPELMLLQDCPPSGGGFCGLWSRAVINGHSSPSCCYCSGKGKRESVINISPTLWSSQCLLEDKGLSSHPWVAASKPGASRLSTWMLSGERKSTSGAQSLVSNSGKEEKAAACAACSPGGVSTAQGLGGERAGDAGAGDAGAREQEKGEPQSTGCSTPPSLVPALVVAAIALGTAVVPGGAATMRTLSFPWGAPAFLWA